MSLSNRITEPRPHELERMAYSIGWRGKELSLTLPVRVLQQSRIKAREESISGSVQDSDTPRCFLVHSAKACVDPEKTEGIYSGQFINDRGEICSPDKKGKYWFYRGHTGLDGVATILYAVVHSMNLCQSLFFPLAGNHHMHQIRERYFLQ